MERLRMKKVALACTGGGIKACVNIGVLRALEDLNFEIEAISGASMGAIIALLHSCNYSAKEIMKIFEQVKYVLYLTLLLMAEQQSPKKLKITLKTF